MNENRALTVLNHKPSRIKSFVQERKSTSQVYSLVLAVEFSTLKTLSVILEKTKRFGMRYIGLYTVVFANLLVSEVTSPDCLLPLRLLWRYDELSVAISLINCYISDLIPHFTDNGLYFMQSKDCI